MRANASRQASSAPAPVEPSLWNQQKVHVLRRQQHLSLGPSERGEPMDGVLSGGSPRRSFAIPPREVPLHETLPPPFQSPPDSGRNSPKNSEISIPQQQQHRRHYRNHSLPPLRSAVGEAGRTKGTNDTYNLPWLPGSSPTLFRNEPARPESRLAGPLPPLTPSLFPHLSPTSPSPRELAMPSPVMQLPPLRMTNSRSESYRIQTKEATWPRSRIGDSPSSSNYPSPSTAGTVGSPVSPQSCFSSTGTYKCQYPGCTVPPFTTQYLLKYVVFA